jgi:hypothetical protein
MKAMVIVKVTRNSAAGVPPRERMLIEMCALDEELAAVGVHSSAKGERITFSGSSRTVIDGPFTETEALIARDWSWQVWSIEQAVERAACCADAHAAPAWGIGSGCRLETT